MKKFLTLFLSFALATTVSAQTVDKEVISKATEATYSDAREATTTVYNDSKTLVRTVYEDAKSLAPDLKDAFKSVANALNTTAENVWDILVMQQLVWSICYSLVIIASGVAWYQFGRQVKRTKTELTDTDEMKFLNVLISAALFVLACYGSMHSVEHIDKVVTGFINPEFGAIRTIVEFISK